jgi:HEAT repeat protein
MFYGLGDETAHVREHMVEMIPVLKPADEILRAAVDQMVSGEIADQMAGLRAARMLLHADAAYARLVDFAAVERLARGGEPEVRGECMHLAGYTPGADGLRLMLLGTSDEDATVRAAALRTVALLDERPHALQIARLLTDADDDVRTAAVYALNQCPDFSEGLLTRAAHDPSDKVRTAVAAVLDERRSS